MRRYVDRRDNRYRDNRQRSDSAFGALNLDAGSHGGSKRTQRVEKAAEKQFGPKPKEPAPVLMDEEFPDLAGNVRKESEKPRTVAWGPQAKHKEVTTTTAHIESKDQLKSDAETTLCGEPWPNSEEDAEESKKQSEADKVSADVDESDDKTKEAAEEPV
jgi:hypothetical protein